MEPRLFSNDSVLFFETSVGSSETINVTFRNKGVEPLIISALQISDTLQFSASYTPELPLVLEKGGTFDVRVNFTPIAAGPHPGQLLVTSTDSENTERTILLSGEGLDPTAILPAPVTATGPVISIYPNPVSDRLLIDYKLPEAGRVSLEIVDIAGRLVYSSSWNAEVEGSREIRWNELNRADNSVTNGVYLVVFRTSQQVITSKIIK
jgi:hypothetical protein